MRAAAVQNDTRGSTTGAAGALVGSALTAGEGND